MKFRDIKFGGITNRYYFHDLDNIKPHQNVMFGEIFRDYIYEHKGCFIKPGDVVLDGGANVGVFTLYALMKGAKLVITVEPNPTVFYLLQKTLSEALPKINNHGRVVFVNRALWNSSGEYLRFNTSLSGSGSARVVQRGQRHQARVLSTTIDLLVEEIGEGVNFVKLDIEGSELKALSCAIGSVKKYKPSFSVCLYHKPEDAVEIPEFMNNLQVYEEPVIVRYHNHDKVGIWS